jgi:hypothetical protein
MQSEHHQRSLPLVPGVSIGPWTLGTSRKDLVEALQAEDPNVNIFTRAGESVELRVRLGTLSAAFDFGHDDRLRFIEVYSPGSVVFNNTQLLDATVREVHKALGRPDATADKVGLEFPTLRVCLYLDDEPTPTGVVIGVGTYLHGCFDGLPDDRVVFTLPDD